MPLRLAMGIAHARPQLRRLSARMAAARPSLRSNERVCGAAGGLANAAGCSAGLGRVSIGGARRARVRALGHGRTGSASIVNGSPLLLCGQGVHWRAQWCTGRVNGKVRRLGAEGVALSLLEWSEWHVGAWQGAAAGCHRAMRAGNVSE